MFWFRRALLRLRLRYAVSAFASRRFARRRFLFVPPSCDAADPTIAGDIVAGQMVLAGRSLLFGKRSVFDHAPPSEAFASALHGFGWLSHFDVNDRRSIREFARSIIRDWMERRKDDATTAFEHPTTVARRVIAWISHSALIAEDADLQGYGQLLQQLARDVSLLRVFAGRNDVGVVRLQAAIALVYHALAMDGSARAIASAESLLRAGLQRQLMPDGCTRDRNAASAVRVAADLIPVLALYRARQLPAPDFLTAALQSIGGFVRMMQHDDGGLAHFNMSGLAARDLVIEVNQHGAGRVSRSDSAPQSGYVRLENKHCVLLVETGSPGARSAGPCAGALSFEFSTRIGRLIVNCGYPAKAAPRDEADLVFRAGQAHSTVLVDNHPLGTAGLRRSMAGGFDLVSRYDQPAFEPLRKQTERGETIIVGHGGLRERTGYVVERELTLLADGGGLAGIDRIIEAAQGAGNHRVTLLFHVHPLVEVEATERPDTVLLRLNGGLAERSTWLFEAVGMAIQIEESRCFERDLPNSVTVQIVIDFEFAGNADVLWRLVPLERFGAAP